MKMWMKHRNNKAPTEIVNFTVVLPGDVERHYCTTPEWREPGSQLESVQVWGPETWSSVRLEQSWLAFSQETPLSHNSHRDPRFSSARGGYLPLNKSMGWPMWIGTSKAWHPVIFLTAGLCLQGGDAAVSWKKVTNSVAGGTPSNGEKLTPACNSEEFWGLRQERVRSSASPQGAWEPQLRGPKMATHSRPAASLTQDGCKRQAADVPKPRRPCCFRAAEPCQAGLPSAVPFRWGGAVVSPGGVPGREERGGRGWGGSGASRLAG